MKVSAFNIYHTGRAVHWSFVAGLDHTGCTQTRTSHWGVHSPDYTPKTVAVKNTHFALLHKLLPLLRGKVGQKTHAHD